MKNNKLLSFLLAGSLLGHTAPTQCMNYGAWFFAACGYWSSILQYEQLQKAATQLKQYANNASQKELADLLDQELGEPKESLKPYEEDLQKHLNELAQYHGLEKVNFMCIDSNSDHAFGSNSTSNVVLVSKNHYEDLLEIASRNKDKNIFIHKDTLSQIDRQKIAEIESSIHHELGHLKYNSNESYLKIKCLKPAIAGCLIAASLPKDEDMQPSANKIVIRAGIVTGAMDPIASLIVGGLFTTIIPPAEPEHQFARQAFMTSVYNISASCIMHCIEIAFGKYDETRADDNIPNNPELLRAQVDFYKEISRTEEDTMRERPIERMIVPAYRFLFDPHPSHEWRAQRFQNRLDALTAQARRNQASVATALKQHPAGNAGLKNLKPSPTIMNNLRTALNKGKTHDIK